MDATLENSASVVPRSVFVMVLLLTGLKKTLNTDCIAHELTILSAGGSLVGRCVFLLRGTFSLKENISGSRCLKFRHGLISQAV